MNRKIYIAFAAALTMFAACSEHPIDPVPQVPDSSHSYIFFEPEVVETVTTRGTENTKYLSEYAPGKSFGVLGVYGTTQLFKPTNSSTGIAEVSPVNGVYTYSPLETWKSKDGSHTFYAFFPYDDLASKVKIEEASVNAAKTGIPYVEYSINDNIDVISDCVLTSKTATGIVEFELEHRLSGLVLEVVNNQSNNSYNPNNPGNLDNPATEENEHLDPLLTIVSAKLTITNIPSTGKLYLDGTPYVSTRISEPKEYDLHTTAMSEVTLGKKDSQTSTHTFNPVLLFPTAVLVDAAVTPNTKVQYRLDFKFKNAWGVQYDFSYPATANTYDDFAVSTFAAGNLYKLTVKKKDDGTFEVSTSSALGWDTHPDISHTFN